MEVATADGFVFKRRRKEEASTSRAQPVPSGVHIEEQNDVVNFSSNPATMRSAGPSRRKSNFIIREEVTFPPYPVGGAFILPDDDSAVGDGERLVKLCHEVASTEHRNVSKTFVGKSEEISHLVEMSLQKFEEKVRGLVMSNNLQFLSKESQALNAKKQMMTKMVQSLESELKSWKEIEAMDTEPTADLNAYAEEEEKGREEAKKGAQAKVLSDDFNNTLHNIDIQVNSLCSVVGSVESLCNKAEKLTRDLQCEYHKQTFNPFPHVNSPATLIKSLIKPMG